MAAVKVVITVNKTNVEKKAFRDLIDPVTDSARAHTFPEPLDTTVGDEPLTDKTNFGSLLRKASCEVLFLVEQIFRELYDIKHFYVAIKRCCSYYHDPVGVQGDRIQDSHG